MPVHGRRQSMLELSIFAVIGLAAVYWTALWLMGRHEDVLHGDFVTPAAQGATPAPPEPFRPRLPPELPRRPAAPRPAAAARLQPAVTTAKATGPVMPAPSMIAAPAVSPRPEPAPAAPRPATAAATAQPELLASLLETIKRDLNDAVEE
jgi:hypothetical protein